LGQCGPRPDAEGGASGRVGGARPMNAGARQGGGPRGGSAEQGHGGGLPPSSQGGGPRGGSAEHGHEGGLPPSSQGGGPRGGSAEHGHEGGLPPSRLVGSEALVEDDQLDTSLRPKTLDEYVGQEAVREQLGIQVEAAKRRGEPVEHVLLAGPPGLGKTTLAYIIANELGVAVRTTSGPAIDHAGALGSILMQMADRDVFFIDEIHRLNRIVEESLYPALEDYTFDTVLGKGVGAR